VAGNLARQPFVTTFGDRIDHGPLLGADRLHDRGLYLGLHSTRSERDIDRLVSLLGYALGSARRGRQWSKSLREANGPLSRVD
jgi:hypothetical protein